MIDSGMTVDMWVSFVAITSAIFAAGAFIVMCGIAIMKAAGVF